MSIEINDDEIRKAYEGYCNAIRNHNTHSRFPTMIPYYDHFKKEYIKKRTEPKQVKESKSKKNLDNSNTYIIISIIAIGIVGYEIVKHLIM